MVPAGSFFPEKSAETSHRLETRRPRGDVARRQACTGLAGGILDRVAEHPTTLSEVEPTKSKALLRTFRSREPLLPQRQVLPRARARNWLLRGNASAKLFSSLTASTFGGHSACARTSVAAGTDRRESRLRPWPLPGAAIGPCDLLIFLHEFSSEAVFPAFDGKLLGLGHSRRREVPMLVDQEQDAPVLEDGARLVLFALVEPFAREL